MVTVSAVEPGLRLDCLGISHRTATPELRERTGFSATRLRDALSAARHDARIERLVIIATCHRTELYAETPLTQRDTTHALIEWWATNCSVPAGELTPHTYSLTGMEAARHLFHVAAGLDSVVLGEAQIVNQVASSLRQSVAVHAASPLLKLAFKSAVHAGERSRAQVWGRLQAASLGSAAVDAAEAASDGLSGANVVIVGAGEIAELALRALAARQPKKITIANRTLEAAQEIGARYGAGACPLVELPVALRDADVVIAATRAMQPLIDMTTVVAALANRPSRPMTLVDVSLPRNIDTAVRCVTGAHLIGIDDLGGYISTAHTERRAVVPSVESIIDEELALLRVRIERRTAARRRAAAAAVAGAVSGAVTGCVQGKMAGTADRSAETVAA